jgi:hypothetical protein
MDLTNPLSDGGADQGRCGCGMVLFKKLMKKTKFSFFFLANKSLPESSAIISAAAGTSKSKSGFYLCSGCA